MSRFITCGKYFFTKWYPESLPPILYYTTVYEYLSIADSWRGSLESFVMPNFALQCQQHRWAWLRAVLSTTPRRLTPCYQQHRWAWLRAINNTAELDSMQSTTRLSLTPCNQQHRWAWLRTINNTTELDSVQSTTPRSLTTRYQWHCRVVYTGEYLHKIFTVCKNTSAYE